MKPSSYKTYDDLPLFLNTEQVATVLGIAPSSTYELMHQSDFPTLRIGKRIVIPKEIRRTLHIRESDPLEIFTDREGQVILKKYSPIGEMTTFAKQYAESLAQVSGHATLIADRDQFIAVSGGCKQLLNKSVSRQLEERVNNRETVIAAKGDRNYVNIAEDIAVDYAWQLITPIICEGDIIGSVILLENDGKSKMGEVEQKLALSAAGFLGRQMEQ